MTDHKKLAIIGATLAVLTLAGCHKCPEVVITTEHRQHEKIPETIGVPESTDIPVSTTAITIPATTSAVTTVDFPEELVPEVVAAETYTKGAIGFERVYFHSVSYPKILSDAPGAAKLNQKFADEYTSIIDTLKNNAEGTALYNVSFSSSACNGIVFIRFEICDGVICDTGPMSGVWVEETITQEIFYYDVKNDREMTLDEYIAYFGIDLDKAKKGALCSYEAEISESVKGNAFACENIGADAISDPDNDRFYYLAYKDFKEGTALCGIEMQDAEMILYYDGVAWHAEVFDCTLLRDTYAPRNPNYACTVSVPRDATDSDTVDITFKDGKVGSIALPVMYNITSVKITARKLELRVKSLTSTSHLTLFPEAGKTLNTFRITPYYDGYTPHITNFAGQSGGTYYNGCHIYEYVPIDTLETLKITIEKKD
ncbi:MAG: hypothetical protein IJX64_00350 [Clostridia bacterium]|nr:hypothetical protein [Clostridia bacterium]